MNQIIRFFGVLLAGFILIPNFGFASNFYAETDTIPPIITEPAQDLFVECGIANVEEDLTAWYNFAGGLQATDNETSPFNIQLEAEPTLGATLENFNSNSICGESRSVTVNFFAVDSCGNRSEASPATFTSRDTRGPTIFRNAQNQSLNCSPDSRDSLRAWMDRQGGALANDFCGTVQWLRFAYSDNAGNSGTGFLNSDTIRIPDGICNWRATVSFIAIDECGNQSVTTSNFTLIDTRDPSLNFLPGDTTVTCADIGSGLGIFGVDNCDLNPSVSIIDSSSQSQDQLNCQFYNYSLKRTYLVEDDCGNSFTYSHNITVIDDVAPTFDLITDTILDCSLINAPGPDLMPTNIVENCSQTLTTFQDSIIGDGCSFTILRTYSVTDVCGNSTSAIQMLEVIDTIAPDPGVDNLDYIVDCSENDLLSFEDFLAQADFLVITDNCSQPSFFVAERGSYNPADSSTFPGIRPSELGTIDCGQSEDGFIFRREVDFVFFDDCANVTVIPAIYAIADIAAPTIVSCPSDFSLIGDSANCEALFTLPVLDVVDNCSSLESTVVLNGSVELQPTDENINGSPIRTAVIQITNFNPFFIDVGGDAILEVTLKNTDASDPDQFFTIISEISDSIGITSQADTECGNSTVQYMIDQSVVSSWIQDGRVRFLFLQDNRETILDICDNSEIEVSLTFPNQAGAGVNQFVLIDGILIDEDEINEQNQITLGPGEHQISQILFDCGGNSDTCTYMVEILDTLSPVITCPDDLTLSGTAIDCNIDIIVPLDLSVEDNCALNGTYSKTLPDDENVFFSFSSPGSGLPLEAQSKTIIFDEVSPILFSNVNPTLTIDITADINDGGELIEIRLEDNFFLGFIGNTGGSDCDRHILDLEIPLDSFNIWTLDNSLKVDIVPLGSTDGINPCNELLSDNTDGISAIRGTLTYNDAILQYQVFGADTLDKDTLMIGVDGIELSVPPGLNTIVLYAEDISGNMDTCSFTVTINDDQAPEALCKPLVIFLEPDDVSDLVLDPTLLDDGSTDNCSIDSMRVDPPTFSCDNIGEEIDVTFFVYDESGNVDSCQTQVVVRTQLLEPTFELDVCTNDTLRLFANVPPPPIPNAYSFRWTGPFFTSFSENPIITNVGGTNNGTYTLEVTGFNGCIYTGTVDVNVNEIISPVITSPENEICQGESLLLTTNGLSGNVTYSWYQGIHPNGILLENTEAPSYLTVPPAAENFYYLIIEQNGCESNPSVAKRVNTVEPPVVTFLEDFISVCADEFITFGTNLQGSNLEYFWSGPNQFTSNEQFPDTIFSAGPDNAGTYNLYVMIGDCISDTASLSVTVFDRPITPIIEGNAVFCEGSSLGLTVNNIPNALEYEWFLDGDLNMTTSTNTLIINDVTDALSGDWTVRVSDDFCESELSDPLPVSIESDLTITAGNNGPGCEGDSVLLTSSFVPEASYAWTGPGDFSSDEREPLVPALAGEYMVQIITSNGCEAEATTTVEVVEAPEITALSTNALECMMGDTPIGFFPSIFPVGDYEYEWIGPNGFTADSLNPVITNASSSNNGTYTLTVLSGSCRSQPASVEVNITDIPTEPMIRGDQAYCAGEDVILSTDAQENATTYIWSTPQGQKFTDDPELIIPAIEVEDAGRYSVAVQSGNCRSSFSDSLAVAIDELPFNPVISYNGPLCPGDTIFLSSTTINNVVYAWTGPNGFVSSEQNPVIPNADENNMGIYSLIISQGACEIPSNDLDVQVISEMSAPSISSQNQSYCIIEVPSSVEICVNASMSPDVTYLIYRPGENEPIGQSTAICQNLLDYISLEEGENQFFIRSQANDCISNTSDTITIFIEAIPILDAEIEETDLTICDNQQSITLTSLFGPPEVQLSWTPVGGNQVISPIDDKAVRISNLRRGNNDIRLTYSTDQCPDFSSSIIPIRVEESSIVRDDNYDLTAYTPVLLTVFDNDDLAENVEFNIINQPVAGAVTIDENGALFSPDIRFVGSTSFTYEVCDIACGNVCLEATVFISIGDAGDCTAPTIFTPNQDGYNDFFVIPCLGSGSFPDNKLTVFNQWGGVIIERENYQNDWDGTYNGKDIPVGTYFYILNLGNNSDPIVGFLIVER